MTQKETPLNRLLYGQGKICEYARQSLPMLVRWAEQQRDFPLSDARPHTYLELAKALDPPTHQRVVPTALGLIGHALAELSVSAKWTKGKIPDIQLLIWSKGKNRPGDSGLTARLNRSVLAGMTIADKKTLSLNIWQEVISYRYWPDVLKLMNLQSLEAEIPNINDTLELIANARSVVGESVFHEKLKHFVRDNHGILNLSGKFTATTEKILLSGDRIDVLLEEVGPGRRVIGVEVKSRVSNEEDLIRGLFQCIKYRYVLRAHNVYSLSKDSNFETREVDVLLVVEKTLPRWLLGLSDQLGVQVVKIEIPT